jgi:DNA-binding FadR family transcriptional regulator
MALTPESAVDACARDLRESILRGALPPGVRLPTERSLAEQFGVNRATVRGALARLEAEHLVSVRQGSGYTVHDFRREAGPDLIGALADLAATAEEEAAIVRDLLHVRRGLARAVLERLVESPNPRALDRVEDAIDRFAALAATHAPTADLARADLDVVSALVAATGSTVLQLCLNPVAALLARLPRLQEAMYRDAADNVLAFRAVLAWVRSEGRGPEGGLDAMVLALAARDDATIAALKVKPRRKHR